MHISKRAKELDLKESARKWFSAVWKEDKGFFENAITGLSYIALAAVPVANWALFLIPAFAAHGLGLEPAKFGAWLDKQLGLKPGQLPDENIMRDLGSILTNAVTASDNSHNLTKNASLFTPLFRSKAVIGKVVKAIYWLISWVLKVFAIAQISDLGSGFKGMFESDENEIDIPRKDTKTQTPTPQTPVKPKGPEDIDNADEWFEYIENKYK